MTDKELARQILDRLQEWATLDAPAAEWFPNQVERLIQERLAEARGACLNLGAEIAMATNAMPTRRAAGVMDAFRRLEEAINTRTLSSERPSLDVEVKQYDRPRI